MTSPLSALGVTLPVIAAPMAGGPTTVDMVLAAAQAGSFGFLAAGYKTPEAMHAEISQVRSAAVPFGVNLFAPNSVPVEPEAYRRYAAAIQPEADRFELTLPADPIEDDDSFGAKIDALLARAGAGRQLHVRNPRRHRDPTACSRPARSSSRPSPPVRKPNSPPTPESTRSPSKAPSPEVIPARSRPNGDPPKYRWPTSSRRSDITSACRSWPPEVWPRPRTSRRAISAGAAAAAVGTVLLRARESGASATHRAALIDPRSH